jgi:hypothetical protein
VTANPELNLSQLAEAEVDRRGDGYVLKADPAVRVSARAHKMSKSRGNVVRRGGPRPRQAQGVLPHRGRAVDARSLATGSADWHAAAAADGAALRRGEAPRSCLSVWLGPAPRASCWPQVNPDDVVDQFGADSLRLYEMFMGPLRDTKVRAGLLRWLCLVVWLWRGERLKSCREPCVRPLPGSLRGAEALGARAERPGRRAKRGG